MTATFPRLGPWVETRTEHCRNGRSTTIAVNRSDGRALLLDGPDTSLNLELEVGGYLADTPSPLAAPTGSRFLRFLRTFDVHWSRADSLVALVHDRVAARCWRRSWLIPQCALAVAGMIALVAAITSGRTLELRPNGWHLPAYLAMSLVAIGIHELGHGVVLTHYGRKVSSIGFRLHLGSPAFYVESVEAFLLTRRQRLLQAAAGLWAEWQFISITCIALWLAPDTAITPVLHRFVIMSAITALMNLLPFAGLDGSLLFADLVREPNLSADSKRALLRLTHDRRPGDGLLVGYALVNGLVSTALFLSSFGLWFLVFGSLVRNLVHDGPLGLVLATLIVAVSFGPSVASLVRYLRRITVIDRVVFRFERRRRVSATRRFAEVATFEHLDELGLGVLAGQLDLQRTSRSNPLHREGFTGWLAVGGPVDLDDRSGRRHLAAGVHRVDGFGVAIRPTRRFTHVTVALLDHDAHALVERVAQRAAARP